MLHERTRYQLTYVSAVTQIRNDQFEGGRGEEKKQISRLSNGK